MKKNNKKKKDKVKQVVNVSIPKSEVIQSSNRELDNIAGLVENIISQENFYILPRAVGGVCAPHHFEFKTPYVPPIDPDNGAVKSALIFRPDPEVFMEQSLLSPNTTGDWGIKQDTEYKFVPQANLPISLDSTLLSPAVVKASSATNSQGFHFSSSGKKLKAGLKYYSGVWTIPNADLSLKIFNPNPDDVTMYVGAGTVNANGTAIVNYTTVSQACASKSNTTFTFDHTAVAFGQWQTAASSAASKGIFIAVFFSSPAPGSVFAGFQASIVLTGFTRQQATSWKNFSLWDLLDPQTVGTARTQFQNAARFSTTGFKVLLTNTTTMLNKGGSIYAARLPGDSVPEGTIDGLIATVGSQTHHRLLSNDLSVGACLPWTPEKIQDWMYLEHVDRDPYGSDPLNKPYIVVAMDFTGFVSGSQPSFMISGGFSMEYLTTDISNTFLKSPGCLDLLELLAAELGSVEVFSENPLHLEKLKDIVKQVMTSDNMKKFARVSLTTGMKLAPLVLSMLG